MLLEIWLSCEEWQRKQRELDRKYKHVIPQVQSTTRTFKINKAAIGRWLGRSSHQVEAKPAFVNVQPEPAEA